MTEKKKNNMLLTIIYLIGAPFGFFMIARQVPIIIMSIAHYFRSDREAGIYAIWKQVNEDFNNPVLLFILSGIVFLLLLYYYFFWNKREKNSQPR